MQEKNITTKAVEKAAKYYRKKMQKINTKT